MRTEDNNGGIMNKFTTLLTAAVVTGLMGSVAQADHHEGDKKDEKAVAEKASCKGMKADANKCKGMKKKKKGDKNSCKNGCEGKEAPAAAPAEMPKEEKK